MPRRRPKASEPSRRWGDRLTWRAPWAKDSSRFVAIGERPVLMDSGWFHDSSSQPALGYVLLRRVVAFHHQASLEDRSAYVKEVGEAVVVDDLGATIDGGTVSGGGDTSSDVVWLEYMRDHTSVY